MKNFKLREKSWGFYCAQNVWKGIISMDELMIKEVDLLGDTIVAAQDKEGQVWAGVRWLCDGLGLSRGQMNNESIKIKGDLVLGQGARNMMLPTKGGKQEVLCLRHDFVPLWIAKITVTPAMKEHSPALVDKLVNYQLKAKDVLAAAFLPQTKPKTQAEVILAQAQQLVEQEQRLTTLEENSSRQERKLEELEAQITTHPVDYYTIAGYANLKGIRLDVTRANMLGRKAVKLSREYGYDVGKTQDVRFGTVNTYHIDILNTVFKG